MNFEYARKLYYNFPFSIFAAVLSENKITGIILAGGKSSRMGMDKGFCAVNGKPMVQYAIEVLEQICDSLIISSNNSDYELFGFPVIPDLIKDIGPMGGIYTGLKQSETQYNFFLSCDMPMVTSDIIWHILEQKQNYDAIVPLWNNYPEPMCAYYNKNIINTLEDFIKKKNFKIQDIYPEIDHKKIDISPDHPFYSQLLFTNVNCGADLQRINEKK
jgi:molybdopterin-guanine dinucleotide biosynthesis protein A